MTLNLSLPVTVAGLEEIEDRFNNLAAARKALVEAEEALLRSKLALSRAERELDALETTLQAEAPRDKYANEVQRKAYALAGSRSAAETVETLRAEHVEREVARLRAVSALRYCEDTRDMLAIMSGLVAVRAGVAR